MKKIKMNLQQLEHAEVLTRSQLKKVLGGTFGSTTSNVTTGCKQLQMDCATSDECCSKCCLETFKGYLHCVTTGLCEA